MDSSQYLGPFEGLNGSLKEEFLKYATVIEFSKESNPFEPDALMQWFYIIKSGKVKVYDINFQTNREQTIYLLGRGDMYDIIPLLDGKLHNLATDILEAGEAIRFPLEKVREWMKKFPHFEQLIYRYVAKQMRAIEELALELSLLDTKDRLLGLLLKNIESIEHRGVDFLHKLSHAEIASLIGTVRHVVDRHLKSFKQEGLIESQKEKKFHIKNINKVINLLQDAHWHNQ